MQPRQRVLTFYILFQLLFNLLLWIPVFYEVQKQLGLSDPEIFRIQSIYYLVFCFLEVPTGFLADRFGYKSSMVSGAAALALANLLPILSGTYTGFLAHFCMIALARSLISGAASAWLFEYLDDHGQAADYKKIEGDGRFYALVARVISWAAVGYLMQIDLLLPYYISAGNALLAGLLVLFLPAVNVQTSPGKQSLLQSLATAGKIVAGSPLLLLLMMQGVGLFILVRVLQVNLYQPILTAKSFDATTFGLIMSVMTIFEAIGSKQAHRFRRVFSDLNTVLMATLVLTLMLAVIAGSGGIAVLAGFCVFSFAAGIAFPIQRQVMNEAIKERGKRATILSMESIIDRALCAVVVLPLGGLLAAGHLRTTLFLCAAGFALLAIVIQILIRKTMEQTTRVGEPCAAPAALSTGGPT